MWCSSSRGPAPRSVSGPVLTSSLSGRFAFPKGGIRVLIQMALRQLKINFCCEGARALTSFSSFPSFFSLSFLFFVPWYSVGTVNKVGADYVGVLVLGFINASIGADRIRKDLVPQVGEGAWVSRRDPSHRMAVGTEVAFTLVEVARHGDFISLVGALMAPGTTGAVAQILAGGGKDGGSGAKESGEAGGKGGKEKKRKKEKAAEAEEGGGKKKKKKEGEANGS